MNLEHVSGYARTSQNVQDIAGRLLDEILWPRSIAGVITDARVRGITQGYALAALFYLVWERMVWINLNDPIRTHTQVRTQQLPADTWTPWVRTLRRG